MATMAKVSTVKEYLDTLPNESREVLEKFRDIIMKVEPTATEYVSYNMPAYKLGEELITYFAAWKEHVAIYATTLAEFKSELEPFLGEKGAIKFPLKDPIPYDLFERLIEARVKQIKG